MKNFIAKLTGLFGGKLMKIEKLTTNQLEDEKIRLQTIQEGFISEVKQLENKKRTLFEEGRKKKSALEKQAIAVQIKQVDDEAKDVFKASNIIKPHPIPPIIFLKFIMLSVCCVCWYISIFRLKLKCLKSEDSSFCFCIKQIFNHFQYFSRIFEQIRTLYLC